VAKAQPPSKPAPSGQATAPPIPPPPWGVQLIGDRSEIRALAIYQQLQKKHQAILGSYQPVVVRTTLRGAAVPIWTRVRVDASTREVAQYLCAKLRTAGESCLVQRN
jgi:hypothetical protein